LAVPKRNNGVPVNFRLLFTYEEDGWQAGSSVGKGSFLVRVKKVVILAFRVGDFD
jgi:hypothetical protein